MVVGVWQNYKYIYPDGPGNQGLFEPASRSSWCIQLQYESGRIGYGRNKIKAEIWGICIRIKHWKVQEFLGWSQRVQFFNPFLRLNPWQCFWPSLNPQEVPEVYLSACRLGTHSSNKEFLCSSWYQTIIQQSCYKCPTLFQISLGLNQETLPYSATRYHGTINYYGLGDLAQPWGKLLAAFPKRY